MDWFLQGDSPDAASALRAEIGSFLRRHAADPDEAWAAELAVAELVANAVEHVGGPVWVTLDWAESRPLLTVHDVGPAFPMRIELPEPTSSRGRGLWLVSHLAGELEQAAKAGGGKRISVVLPVRRAPQRSFDPTPRTVNPLPELDEAGADGFGQESFLRALVVEMSRSVEDGQGPAAAEATVARVGATVGGQMEREYRAARDLGQPLDATHLAACYVRLKSAIGGDFYPIEIGPDHVVLGNRRCPFGEAVKRSPALCRMTSSVFGGIAARNHGRAVVRLEERIAVGDPQCRVSVRFGPQVPDSEIGHGYGEQASADPGMSGITGPRA